MRRDHSDDGHKGVTMGTRLGRRCSSSTSTRRAPARRPATCALPIPSREPLVLIALLAERRLPPV